MSDDAVVVTGLGAVSCFGRGVPALWNGIAQGRDGIRRIERFSTEGFAVHEAGLVPEPADNGLAMQSDAERCVDFGIWAAREAWADAGLSAELVTSARVALIVGTSPGFGEFCVHQVTERVGDALELRGPRITVSTACSSSTNALGLASDLLEGGHCDLAIAGGCDVLTPLLFAGFHALSVLSVEKCAPFSHPAGTSLGEGAGFMVLERRQTARVRGVRLRSTLLGYGLSCDAYHETSPDPTGAGVARAVCLALHDAGLRPEQIGYVNAHGTGTAANDPAEWRALCSALGSHARSIPVSSTKSVLGHAQAAAGVLEAMTTLLALERGLVPQTLHFRGPRPNAPDDPVGQSTPRAARYEHALSTNSAFGGANAAIVLATPEASKGRSRARGAVWVTGLSAITPQGLGLDFLLAALERGQPLAGGRLPRRSCEEALRDVDPSSLDPSSLYLTAAASLALEDAGIRRVRGEARDHTGLLLGITKVSLASVRALEASVQARGLPFLSAPAFARMVLNAPAGSCSKLLGLRGPGSTVSVGEGSGLMAAIYAARLLLQGQAERMVAAGVDEIDHDMAHDRGSEGASCLVLSAARPEREPAVRFLGLGVAGPGRVAEAAARALGGMTADAVFGDILPEGIETGLFFASAAVLGRAEAASSILSLAAAAAWLRLRGAGRALVVSAGGRSASLAALLAVEEGSWTN